MSTSTQKDRGKERSFLVDKCCVRRSALLHFLRVSNVKIPSMHQNDVSMMSILRLGLFWVKNPINGNLFGAETNKHTPFSKHIWIKDMKNKTNFWFLLNLQPLEISFYDWQSLRQIFYELRNVVAWPSDPIEVSISVFYVSFLLSLFCLNMTSDLEKIPIFSTFRSATKKLVLQLEVQLYVVS